nr:putative capsid [Marmot picobirnavirus]
MAKNNQSRNTNTKQQKGSSNRRAPRKDYRSKARKEDKNEEASESKQYTNDPAWYASDASLARDSAAIPFSWATGTTSGLSVPEGNFVFDSAEALACKNFVSPGIMTMWLSPSIGEASTPASPINVAAASIYSYVRHANSGHSNYNATDLMLYLIAIGEVIAFSNFLIRAYGTAALVSNRNRYLPKMLLEAQRIDAEDLQNNLAQFRYGINLAMNKLSSFAVPANFTYYRRKGFLYSGIYTEGQSAKDQIYIYAPAGFLRFDSNAGSGPTDAFEGCLTYIQYNTTGQRTLYKASDLLKMLNGLIDQIVMSEDLNIMSGDILKAYGEGGIMKYGRLEPDFTMGLTYDTNVLEQMKNATILPECQPAAGSMVVKQDPTKAYLVSNSTLREIAVDQANSLTGIAQTIAGMKRILTTSSPDTSPELILEATRLMTGVLLDKDTLGTSYTLIYATGTEIAVDCEILAANPNTEANGDYSIYKLQTFMTTRFGGDSDSVESLMNKCVFLGLRSAFEYAPNLFLLSVSQGVNDAPGTIRNMAKFISFNNYAIVAFDELYRMHEACFLNMLRVPAIGSSFTG